MKNKLLQFIGWYFKKGVMPYWLVMCIDLLIVLFAGLVGEAMRLSPNALYSNFCSIITTLFCYLLAYALTFRLMHTNRNILRYSTFIDLYRVAVANVFAVAIIVLVRLCTPIDEVLYFIAWRSLCLSLLFSTISMWSLRIFIKYIYDAHFVKNTAQKVFIYGVKEGGMALAKSLNSQESQYVVAGFATDEESVNQYYLMGKKVYRLDDKIVEVMRRKGAKILMVSPLKSDALRANEKMIDSLTAAGIKIFLYASQEWDGKSDINHHQLKEVDIEDLLPRNPIEVDMEAIGRILTGQCVMITGAAGSIGSEIVRQVASFKPSQMVLIDQAETPLHDIRLMMARKFADIPALTLTASICHTTHMEEVFKTYRPAYVFHAAAYKHVPMMEDNPSEAIYNNINGTRIIADLAVKYGVKKFVMISTDKAVNPTNVMGCSKRICEMYCQSLNKAIADGKVSGATQFVTTRFGNVLGSNGSVIPIFKEQLRNGGPLTVTHPEIIRYFMLIPEACRLVLQAGSMGNGGEIFVFDMGKPVRIADLAKRMIQLSGMTDVTIKYTGLRDGEKLYEELLNKEENTKPSSHPKIKLADVRELEYEEVSAGISQLVADTEKGADDMEIVRQMKVLVPEFKSKHSKYETLD